MDKEKDEVSTRLRLPAELHHKLGALAKLDNNRSLHNFMLKILRDHVYNAESKMLEIYGETDFDHLYIAVFGNKYDPYFFEDDVKNLLNPPYPPFSTVQSARGRQMSTKKQMRGLFNPESLNTNKPSDE